MNNCRHLVSFQQGETLRKRQSVKLSKSSQLGEAGQVRIKSQSSSLFFYFKVFLLLKFAWTKISSPSLCYFTEYIFHSKNERVVMYFLDRIICR